ncbi:MAG: hypothetical protein A2136_03035 [Chloroflexi bacterium RBG_16_54_11]|nr:MAG: hypothetical protein A2136_03035 [Chloroflexi bacterium RBG_16_54_11]
MEALYGQISEVNYINPIILACFTYLSEGARMQFITKFKKHPHPKPQFLHTFSELILGVYLISKGFFAEYEHKFDSEEPDWSILDDFFNVTAIIENVYLHIADKTGKNIDTQKKAGKIAVGYLVNRYDIKHIRLYENVQDKASGYKDLINQLNVPYVVAVSIDSLYPIDDQDMIDCLMSREESLFKLYPYLSGILKFEVFSGTYRFRFFKNIDTLHNIDIPSGFLELPEIF